MYKKGGAKRKGKRDKNGTLSKQAMGSPLEEGAGCGKEPHGGRVANREGTGMESDAGTAGWGLTRGCWSGLVNVARCHQRWAW